jgi:AcrR family transcriptional regulator
MGGTRGSYSSPRQRARQERILQAARELIAAKGYDGLTMRDLARVAGVSDKTLYNLFESKDRLVMMAVVELLEDITRGAETQSGKPGLEAVLLYSDSMTRQILETPAYAEAMARGLFRAEAGNPLVDVLLGGTERFLCRELDAALQREQLPADIDIPVTARMLAGQMWGILLLWNKGLVALEEYPAMASRSLCLSLAGVARGRGKTLIAHRLDVCQANE